jgi:hypothetical protein
VAFLSGVKMYQIKLVVFLFFCLVSSGYANNFYSKAKAINDSETKEVEQNISYIQGIYEGQVESDGITIPITTEISQDVEGNFIGKYRMEEGATTNKTIVGGDLYDFHKEGDNVFLATWKDKYGIGKLRILFDSGFQRFNGFWGNDKQSLFYRWDGNRIQNSR